MKYKYQLIILGSEVPEKAEVLGQITKNFSELNIPEDFLKVIEACNIETEYKGNQPSFALYFGDVDGNFKDTEITRNLLRDGTMILPIFFNGFSSDIPEVLSNQNAIQFSKNEVNRIYNVVLESFELLRTTRKIFISVSSPRCRTIKSCGI